MFDKSLYVLYLLTITTKKTLAELVSAGGFFISGFEEAFADHQDKQF